MFRVVKPSLKKTKKNNCWCWPHSAVFNEDFYCHRSADRAQFLNPSTNGICL